MRLLILYPAIFTCFTKFERKVKNITANLKPNIMCCISDPNNFISQYISIHCPDVKMEQIKNFNEITHAIVFDDGEEFPREYEELIKKHIRTKRIKIKITRVINIKKEKEFTKEKSTNTYEYIGRGSYWGNPYSMFEDGDSREDVIRKFKYDFDYEKFPNKEKSEVYKLAGKRLGCFCKPEACHGDVLAEYLNAWDDGE